LVKNENKKKILLNQGPPAKREVEILEKKSKGENSKGRGEKQIGDRT